MCNFFKNFDIIANSSGLVEAFKNSFNHLADKKQLPNWIYSLSTRQQKNVIWGWYLGDGHFNIAYFMTTISKKLAYEMKLLLANFGFLPNIRIEKPRGNSRLAYRVVIPAWLGNKFFDDNLIFKNKFKKHSQSENHKEFLTIPVMNNTKAHYTGKVCDLQTESGTFMTRCFLVQNSEI